MLDSIIKAEEKYVASYCNEEDFGDYKRYNDDLIKDMYSHNFILIDKDVEEERIHQIISQEIKDRKSKGHGFLRVVSHSKISKEFLIQFKQLSESESYVYYGRQTETYSQLSQKENVKVVRVTDDLTAEHGRCVDIAANYTFMTMEFAIRRIDRNMKVYRDEKKPIDLYVCYDGIEPVGNCELMIGDDIAKIEDFDILEMHQKKGYGTCVLRDLFARCYRKGIPYAYLVTDEGDTAKHMYEKCGMSLVGGRIELMFRL